MQKRVIMKGLFTAAALFLIAVPVNAAISIETVPVGNKDNTADSAFHSGNYDNSGQGAVSYDYNIGKYEVTAGQYTAFLNSVAGVDTHNLYYSEMSNTDYGCGITRTGGGTSGDPYIYAVDQNYISHPVNYVNFWDACRFANWLNNGQKTMQQDANVTEHGAYTLTTNGINNNTILRNDDWKWAVASEDEWYKAAYYNPATDSYYNFPTSNNNTPGHDLNDISGNNANAGFLYPDTTIGGQFQRSKSPYGTFDQGGNVWEWNESIAEGSLRIKRGGSSDYGMSYLASSWRFSTNPTDHSYFLGFRVVCVPEPGGMILLLCCAIAALIRWRRR